MSKKPTVLMILDGYGLNDRHDGNAVYEAKTPVMDSLMADYPFVKGNASGLAVGLPDGQMGNSEVGHMNMGAGRMVLMRSERLSAAVRQSSLAEAATVRISTAFMSPGRPSTAPCARGWASRMLSGPPIVRSVAASSSITAGSAFTLAFAARPLR